jgi:arsenate reductase
MKLYHNPRCSKSRQTLALITEKGAKPEVIEYLKDAPTADEIAKLVRMLGVGSVREAMRTGEAIYKELDLKNLDDEAALIAAIVENPILLERPIFVHGDRAVIGRPPENALSLL